MRKKLEALRARLYKENKDKKECNVLWHHDHIDQIIKELEKIIRDQRTINRLRKQKKHEKRIKLFHERQKQRENKRTDSKVS